MSDKLKQRIVGAIVLISLAVIFIPMLLDGGSRTASSSLENPVPPRPQRQSEPLEIELQIPSRDQMPERHIIEQAEPGDKPGPEPVKPMAAQPVTEETVTAKPAKPVPVEAKPAEAATPGKPVENKPVVSAPVETKPVESKPATPKPVESKPVAVIPVESKPVASKPVEGGKVPIIEKSYGTAENLTQAWVVQVGSFSNSANAVALRDKLRKAGYTAFVEKLNEGGTVSFRVRLGPEARRETADSLLARVSKEHGLSGIVMSYP